MSGSPPERRAVVVAVQRPLDPSLPIRPDASSMARRVAVRLRRGGYQVRLLVDDAPADAARPLLANLLDAGAWLAGAETPLMVLSMGVRDGCLLPRDARADRSRTWLPIPELLGELPPGCGLVFDGGLPPDGCDALGWVLAASDGATPVPHLEDGPSRFLQAIALALGNTADGLSGRAFVEGVVQIGPPAWTRGAPPATLLQPVHDVVRICPACQASIAEARATFCPACGAPLDVSELLDNGRYRLLKRLGAGGMGQVFLAEDTRLKVQRAIKLLALPAELAAPERAALSARMVQEARAAQTLADFTHHVVRVFDVGFAAERGEPYLVMELLDGETLSARLARARLSQAAALRIARTTAAALAEAHARGFVHRDLKPDNIMLCRRDGADDFIKILDFGLVKAEQAEVKTESGHMMGTLQYMPPEQLRGDTIDARADVFSLGAVIYECLSGQRANPGKTQHQIFGVLLDSGIPPLRSVAPDVPADLAALIDRCVRLDRAARPADAGALHAALLALDATGDSIGHDATLLPSTPVSTAVAQRIAASTQASAAAPASIEPVTAPIDPPRGPARWPWLLLGLALVVGIAMLLRPGPGSNGAAPSTDAPATAPSEPLTAKPLTVDPPSTEPPMAASTPPSAAPPTAAKPRPLGPPDAPLIDHPKVLRVPLANGGTRYEGPPAQQRAAIVIDRVLADSSLWPDLDAATRAALARRIDWQAITVDTAGAIAPPSTAPGLRSADRRPIARLLVDPAGPAVVYAPGCRALRGGDRVFTARWTIFGYGGGRCAAATCPGALAQALHKSRRNGEPLHLEITVLRGDDDARETIKCTVARP